MLYPAVALVAVVIIVQINAIIVVGANHCATGIAKSIEVLGVAFAVATGQ